VPDLGHLSPDNRQQIDICRLVSVQPGIAGPPASRALNTGGNP
jgi:hypothetical protein